MKVAEIKKLIDVELFYRRVEALVNDHDMSYLDAIVAHCDECGLEHELAAILIKTNQKIKAKMLAEGVRLNVISA